MANSSDVQTNPINDPRIYCNYSRLVKLRSHIKRFSFFPHLNTSRLLSGRHSSLFRGRGLNFEELRHYQLGDDIRCLDWKVTMRTGKAHSRVYSEEKDHQVIICVDQRSSMFFSSLDTMKSVVAAELAVLSSWRILKESDRVGFYLFNDDKTNWLKPTRSQGELLHYIKTIVKDNSLLSVDNHHSSATALSQVIDGLNRRKLKDSIIIIFSDWNDVTSADIKHLKQLQQHNDILSIMISDPMEEQLDSDLSANWVLSNGQEQLNINTSLDIKKTNQILADAQHMKREQLCRLMAMKALPYIEITTDGSHIAQFIQILRGKQ
ncbi:DUF58 domain-containing protein [Photobacterium angustum]|uniref:MoxR protein n=1 Tax=Photobacterium angustum TaxID=661 RepID=A0A2S7VJ14_PHOAN|nr:DUF58 domain-containing protein [Photobacterium angustum]PQJ61955.1 MoxR protein [Photobacterium angustum]